MDKIRQWTLTVSAVSIVSGLLLSIIPKSSQKSFFKVVASVIMLHTILLPVINSKGIDFDLENFLSDNYQVSENLDKYALRSMIHSAEKAIEDLLYSKTKELGIDCRFECECEIRNEEIAVTEIIVYSPDEAEQKLEIQNLINDFGFDESYIVFEGE